MHDKWNWDIKYPVINISFGSGVYKKREELDKWIIHLLRENQTSLGIDCEDTSFVPGCFSDLIIKSKKKYGQNTVILIDEYDKPILDNITNPEIAIEMREGLKNFYSVIKDHDAYIKFVFLTGVSKFSKVSIFSGLNNLTDITLDSRYATICGYTEKDLITVFHDYLQDKNIDDIRRWHNGYSWLGEKVYNPYSILHYLDTGQFRNYWFETGTPGFLIELFKNKRYFIPQIEEIEAGESIIGSFDVDFIEPENLLFQTGYLTIKDLIEINGDVWYKLSYPNMEVKKSLNEYILNRYSDNLELLSKNRKNLINLLQQGKFEGLKDIMQSHFSSLPSDWYRKNNISEYDGFYASVFYSYFASLGLDIVVEDAINHGKIDMTAKMPNPIYIFEFKVVDSKIEGNTALEQIKANDYAKKYKESGLPIYLAGILFDKEKKSVVGFDWEII